MQSSDYTTVISTPPAQRLEAMARLTHVVRRMSLLGQHQRHPDLAGEMWGRHIAKLWTGIDFVPYGDEMSWIQDSLGLAQQLHPVFEVAEIPYFITGGVASSAWGEPRATRDLDVVIRVGSDRDRLVSALECAGYLVAGVDSSTIQITHQTDVTTADPIVAEESEWDRERFATRRLVGGLWVSSPECLILAKLRWGRGQSGKQRRDIEGILQAGDVDRAYLQKWAEKLGVSALLREIIGQ